MAYAALICLVSFLHFSALTALPSENAVDTNLLAKMSKNQTTWCVVKPSTSQEKLDEIIDYCCSEGRIDCRVIQAGGMCYLPPNKVSDASVVMNIFYKLNGKHPFNCNFNGSGLIVHADPSVGKCVYPA